MKNIEINSDKYTVLGICLVLVLALFSLLSDLYNLVTHHVPRDSKPEFLSYLIAIFLAYVPVTFYRDGRLRKEYPYGVAGACGMAIGFLLTIVVHRVIGAAGVRNTADRFLMLLSVLSLALVLGEGLRWFKRTVRLSH